MSPLAILALTPPASAQVVTNGQPPDLNAQTFRPALDSRRMLVIDDAAMPGPGGQFRALFSYHDDLLVYTPDGGQTQQRLVSNLVQTNLMAAAGIGPARIGIDFPVYLFANGDTTQGQTGFGDLAVDGRVTLFGRDAPIEFPVDLGIQGRVALPTSSVDIPLGSTGPLWRIALVGSTEIGRTLLAANVGTVGMPRIEVENGVLNDAFEYRLGGAYAVSDSAGLSAELSGMLLYGVSNRVGQPLEALLGGYWEPTENWTLRGGVGRGITTGLGSPDLRVILGLAFQPERDARERAPIGADTDGDGILDDQDECVTEPEDLDEVQDSDGCPDATRLVVRVVDEEGNPVRSATVILTSPSNEEQSFGGRARTDATNGPWTATASADTYLAKTVQFDVVDGPKQVVEIALPVDPNARVTIRGGRIDLKETVQFRTSSATILPVSEAMLDEVATIMSKHPEIERVTIEGHTDSRGNDAFNLDLSQRRAASVKTYLEGKGIAPERLASEGFGETRPIDPAETPEAWAKNRRVQLRVTQWAKGTDPDDAQ